MGPLAHNPSLLVELGALFVLVAALVSRVLLRRAGIPSIVTLLAFGLVAGPSFFDFVHVDLTNPATRALLQLAVVLVLFEATLRMDLRGIPKATIALLATLGTALVLIVIPAVAHAYHLSKLLGSMLAAICIVTGPTVIGPLMARIRPRSAIAHLLESEGLVLDALGVIVAAAVFAMYTSRPGTPIDAAWHVVVRIGAGILVGVFWGLLGRVMLSLSARGSSDISKIGVLVLGFGAYATSDWLAHESGLVAVVVCGLMLDFRVLPHERLLRSFKEDLSMLALSVVFVLLASQIQIQRLGPLVVPAAAVLGTLIAIRLLSVGIATISSPFNWAERLFLCSVFPRGIVAVSLATYYATQIPAWGLHGANRLLAILFLIIVGTIATSTPAAIVIARKLRLQLPSVILAGITPTTLETARRYKQAGHTPVLLDTDERAVALALSHDLEATAVDEAQEVSAIVRERRAEVLIIADTPAWRDIDLPGLPHGVTVLPAALAFADHQ